MLQNKEYGAQIKNTVEILLGDGYEIEMNDVNKNNGVVLTGLNIHKTDSPVSSIVYLDEFEANGIDIGIAASKVVDQYFDTINEQEQATGNIQDMLLDKELLLKYVLPKLVNTEKNQVSLENAVHKGFADLAVTYYVLLPNSGNGNGLQTVTLNTVVIQKLDINLEELHEAAIRNMKRNGIVMQDLSEMLGGISGPTPQMPLVVLTNKNKVFGAAALLDENYLRLVADRFDSDLYILPSSIHEVILLPASEGGEASFMVNMVREVNQDYVEPQDFLSDNAYLYDKETGGISVLSIQDLDRNAE